MHGEVTVRGGEAFLADRKNDIGGSVMTSTAILAAISIGMRSRAGSRRLRDAMKAVVLGPLLGGMCQLGATTALSDGPVFATNSVPGNVALALSVEWPTASRAAYPGTNDYSRGNVYRGYFDAGKCYVYNHVATETATNLSHFAPSGAASNRTCNASNAWSGNYLNWATMPAIDPFRWVMTGGHRVIDTPTETILQKAWHSGQGNLFQNKSLTDDNVIQDATPFGHSSFHTRIDGAGFRMLFTRSNISNLNGDGAVPSSPTPYVSGSSLLGDGAVYEVKVRVKVCDGSTAAAGVEANCVRYGSNWKPEGLMQQYANRLRFSAFGYLNEGGTQRDGGVLRARQKFVGPMQPVPGEAAIANPRSEWDAATGVFAGNPDASDAAIDAVANSGVANYLNKFGQTIPGTYKDNDPVGELYYAALRYYKNLGNVPQWTNTGTADAATVSKWLDGFPAIKTWDDPIQYSCQKNFILGIGDIYTHADKNVPGNTLTATEPAMPAAISADTTVNAVTATNKVGVMQGMGTSYGTLSPINRLVSSGGCCSNNAGLMAGLAYDANTQDIRPDSAGAVLKTRGRQTVQTLWVDVLEKAFERDNQFYLAAKYGGFIPPNKDAYDYDRTAALPQDWWSTTGETVGAGTMNQPRPDGYFTAGNPDQMISGLTAAFQRINSLSSSFTTSFSTSLPQVSTTGNASFGAQYDPSNWTGEVVASELNFNAAGDPTLTERWRATTKLAAQLAGTGWDTNRRVITWNGSAGVEFRWDNLSGPQKTALNTSYRSPAVGSDYVNYLRGDRTHEQASTVAGSSRAYRTRAKLLGDIVGSRARPVGPPNLPLLDASNPGYSSFKIDQASRPTVLYVGANDGMLHAFDGSLTGGSAGREIFAYVPSATFAGPTGTPEVNGLASLGKPAFDHRYLVNATPTVFDVDFARTWTGSPVDPDAEPDWRSMLIGGLGKGGRSYYAIDVTNPSTITSETIAAGRVLWEFTAPEMGYTFGEPMVVKTRQYGWTVILPSGYNTPDGKGYLFFVNPRTGELLDRVSTDTGTTTSDAGLAHANAYVLDYTDGYADAVYAGDLLGNLWRFDITAASGDYPAPTLLAVLTNEAGQVQPVTSRPSMELHPKTRKRMILFGTGRLLDGSDIGSTQEQSFYAIEDGNQIRFNRSGQTPAQLPAGIDFPIERGDLVENSDLLQGYEATTTSPMGWYVDLGKGANDVAWRVVSDSANFFGTVAFAPTLPSIADPCEPSGSSRIYATDYASGISKLSALNGDVIAYVSGGTGVVTDLRFLSVGGKVRLIGGTDRGDVRRVPGEFGSTVGLKRLNWRELPVID